MLHPVDNFYFSIFQFLLYWKNIKKSFYSVVYTTKHTYMCEYTITTSTYFSFDQCGYYISSSILGSKRLSWHFLFLYTVSTWTTYTTHTHTHISTYITYTTCSMINIHLLLKRFVYRLYYEFYLHISCLTWDEKWQ